MLGFVLCFGHGIDYLDPSFFYIPLPHPVPNLSFLLPTLLLERLFFRTAINLQSSAILVVFLGS